MASSDLTVGRNEPPHPVSSDDPFQFFMLHGYFYKNNADIGKVVDDLYQNKRAKEAKLDHFQPNIKEDVSLKKLFDKYSIELPRFSRPWGTTEEPYKWSKSASMDKSIIAYILGSNPDYCCWAGSYELEYDGIVVDDGTRRIPEDSLKSYPTMNPKMKDGGVLFVNRLLVHKAEGFAIMVGLVKPPDRPPKPLQ